MLVMTGSSRHYDGQHLECKALLVISASWTKTTTHICSFLLPAPVGSQQGRLLPPCPRVFFLVKKNKKKQTKLNIWRIVRVKSSGKVLSNCRPFMKVLRCLPAENSECHLQPPTVYSVWNTAAAQGLCTITHRASCCTCLQVLLIYCTSQVFRQRFSNPKIYFRWGSPLIAALCFPACDCNSCV